MLFNSYTFLVFFPIVCLLYYVIPKRFAWVFLLFVSYYFYMGWRAEYALLLAGATVSTFVASIIIDRMVKKGVKPVYKNAVMVVGIVFNLLILFYFKYFNFALRSLASVGNLFGVEYNVPVFDIILPVGISFFTLQALGYLIDVSTGRIKCERNIFKYALFVSFFPQLVAGPIERSENLLPQLFSRKSFDAKRVASGLRLMGWGFFQKVVIADRLAAAVQNVYSAYEDMTGITVIAATLLFSIQIYCDFSGYSDIAIGAAEVLGIKLSQNFKRPYFATNFSGFWQRWHISLSAWFQDYLFTPLCWSRWTSRLPLVGRYIKNPPLLSSIMIVFLTSGLWHGASFNFIIWGFLQGVFRIAEELLHRLYRKPPKRSPLIIKAPKRVFVFLLWSFSLIFFRSQGTDAAFTMVQNLFVPSRHDLMSTLGFDLPTVIILGVFIVTLFIGNALQERFCVRDKMFEKPFALRLVTDVTLTVVLVIFSAYGTGYSTAQFIYFQF